MEYNVYFEQAFYKPYMVTVEAASEDDAIAKVESMLSADLHGASRLLADRAGMLGLDMTSFDVWEVEVVEPETTEGG